MRGHDLGVLYPSSYGSWFRSLLHVTDTHVSHHPFVHLPFTPVRPFPWYSVRGSGMVPIHPSWAAMSLCPCSSLVSGMDGWSKVGPLPLSLHSTVGNRLEEGGR